MIEKSKLNIACILTTGRTGSDYLQASLDGVPGIIVLPGQTYFKKFFIESNFENTKYSKIKIINIFIKNYKNLFKNDKLENKKLNLSTDSFKKIFLKISKNSNLNKINFIKYIYFSYEILTRNKLDQIKTIVNHCHSVEETRFFLKIFPHAKVLITIRNPLQNLLSGIKNWKKFSKTNLGQKHNFFYVKRILYDLKFAINLKNKKLFIPLEKSYLKKSHIRLLKFLKVKYTKKIKTATYCGKIWIGDKLSQSRTLDGSFNKRVLKTSTENFYHKRDEYILIYFYRIYQIFGYYKKIKFNFNCKIKYLFFSILPMKFEKETIYEKPLKMSNYFFYIKRVILFIKHI